MRAIACKNPRRMLVALALTAAPMILGCGTTRQVTTPGRFHHVGLIWLKEPGKLVMEHGFTVANDQITSLACQLAGA